MESSEKKRGNEKGVTTATVARQVRKRRQELGMDLSRLSEELSKANWPIPIAALSRLENGYRRIDVDDLMALAVALSTTPNELLISEGDPEFGVATGAPDWLREDEARMWLAGTLPLDREMMRRYWATRIGEYMTQLEVAQANLKARQDEAENGKPQLLADFMIEEAQNLVQHWTEEINKIATREAQLRIGSGQGEA